jgi:ElaB/YqjD/DUF883 family membrane-anchored ribosome-binding protein
VDEATRTSGPPVEDGQRDPDEIRADIEQSREELGETVEALAAKTDVKAQAQAKVDDVKDQARSKVESVKEKVSSAKDGASERTPESTAHGFEQLKAKANERPIHSAAGAAFVVGLLVGLLIAKR